MDPRKQAEEYLVKHKIPDLFQAITAQLLFYKPLEPKEFICQYLEEVQTTGTPTLLSATDIDTMFGMFDITNRGVITVEQANNALKNLLGDAASLDLDEGKVYLKREEFVAAMQQALKSAAPYKA